eukprot:TRINITY_DN1182_c0_g1_i2.p1 TRINITY_DN1182_c0_g1~~TRINITY_DN1182_c0_g1_i2.p1  ORF type:complete len:660 (+),score=70.52 TRINITY_DN1182_c0_g1_i2:538-2517(+)
MSQAFYVSLILCICLLGSALAQTVLPNATMVSAVLAASESRLYEVSVPQDHQLLVTLTILDGSCGNTALRDGGVLPLSTYARVRQLPTVGTMYTAVSACSVNGADKWYFEVTNSQCSQTTSSFQLTVTVVPRPCVLPLAPNTTVVGRVYADEEWAFYSVDIPANTEVRFTVESNIATRTCGLYRIYTRLGNKPNDTVYDTLYSSSTDQKLMEYRSACAPAPGTLYVAMRENCPYLVGRLADYSLQVQTYSRECTPSITGPFPNNQTWTVRPTTMTYFKFTPSSLNLNKNASVLFTLRPLPSSPYQGVALYTRLNDFPTVDVYDLRSSNPSYAAVSYSACNLPSGDIYIGVRNPSSSYSNNLDFELYTTILPINCDQDMISGQSYFGYVSTWYYQRYSVNFGSASKMALSFCNRPGSAADSVGLAVRWNASPANDTVNDWRVADSASCATYYYDSCTTGETPRTGTLYASARAGGSTTSSVVLDYEGKVFLDPRPCVQAVPAAGGIFEESLISNAFVYFYSWEAVAGTKITIDIVSNSNLVSFFYRFGALPTPSEYQVVSGTWPANFTVTSTGTHYFRVATVSLSASIRNPVLASVRFYPPGTQPQFPPTAANTPTPSSTPRPAPRSPSSSGSNNTSAASAVDVKHLFAALGVTLFALFI